jgi:hypothetical protein
MSVCWQTFLRGKKQGKEDFCSMSQISYYSLERKYKYSNRLKWNSQENIPWTGPKS